MSVNLRFYVYVFYDHELPRYVGKGSGRRVRNHFNSCTNRRLNKFIQNCIENDIVVKPKIVFRTDDEDEALAYEVALIAQYGRHDLGTGSLFNLTDGGERGGAKKPTQKVVSRSLQILIEIQNDPQVRELKMRWERECKIRDWYANQPRNQQKRAFRKKPGWKPLPQNT